MAESNAIERKEAPKSSTSGQAPKGLIKQTEKEKFLVELRQEERQSKREKAEDDFKKTLRGLAPRRLRISDDRAYLIMQKNPQLVAGLVRRRALVPTAAECLLTAAPMAGIGTFGAMTGDIASGIFLGLILTSIPVAIFAAATGYGNLCYLWRYRKLKKLSGGTSVYLAAPPEEKARA